MNEFEIIFVNLCKVQAFRNSYHPKKWENMKKIEKNISDTDTDLGPWFQSYTNAIFMFYYYGIIFFFHLGYGCKWRFKSHAKPFGSCQRYNSFQTTFDCPSEIIWSLCQSQTSQGKAFGS